MTAGIHLETARLILREFRADDFDAVHSYAIDPEVLRFMSWGPNAPEETHEFLRRKLAEQDADPRATYDLAVVERSSGEMIGSVGLRIAADGTQAALGYCYSRSAWGQGYATEAARELIRFGFEELGLHRVHASCDTENIGSARVLDKLGIRREAHRLEDVWQRGKWRDSYSYAILAREWEAGRQQ